MVYELCSLGALDLETIGPWDFGTWGLGDLGLETLGFWDI